MKKSFFTGKTVFITGGTGTWGQEFTRQILQGGRPKEIRIYSRNEYQQTLMRRRFDGHARLVFLIGDVRDKDRLTSTMREADYVIHLAALKHVPVVEENPGEAILTNVIGTENVIGAAIRNDVKKVLFVSSDKAVDPLNFYGITKLAGERVVIAANDTPGARTRFICYRGGNVMGSSGSAIPIFQEQILRHNEVSVTDMAMTRFFMQVGEIVERAIASLAEGIGGEIFIPHMKAASLETLVGTMVKHLGDRKTKIKTVGVRPGEKRHEHLISHHEAPRTRVLRDRWVILPFFPPKALERRYSQYKAAPFDEFRSDTATQFGARELAVLLKREGFLDRTAHGRDHLFFKKHKWYFS